MIGKKSAFVLTGVLYALFFGSIFSAVALNILSHSHPFLKCLIIGVFLFSFYVVGVWVSVRKAELDKKIPTPSHELRRRRKEFYDWLDSQGRR